MTKTPHDPSYAESMGVDGAIAIFVKTPHLSPVKTRLAQTIGKKMAEEFYILSALSVKSIVQEVTKKEKYLIPYWAIAEQATLHKNLTEPLWKDFAFIYQAEGDLGNRLHCVYEQLIKNYSYVILLGADSPQISSDLIKKTIELLKTFSTVIGPAKDGGFYLFASHAPLSKNIWTSVPYSESTTAQVLIEKIKEAGLSLTSHLPQLSDVDTVEDLSSLFLNDSEHLTSEQKNLLEWLNNFNFYCP